MDNHKKLVMAALALTVVATTASMVAYMTSVSQKSKAATREDIQKLVEDLRSRKTTKPVIAPKLTADKAVVKSAGIADLKTQAASVDKTKLHVEFTNTTGKDLKGAKLFFRVTGKSKFALGTATGAARVKDGDKLKPGFIAFAIPDLKAGQVAKVDVPFIVRTPGSSMQVTALLHAPGAKITSTQPVTIQSK